jgi:hypothetical protein
VYADESLRFCLDDGASLVSTAAAQATIRINPPQTRSAKATEVLPGSRLTPELHKQTLIPWLVTAAALLFASVMVIVITIVIFTNRQSSTSSPNSNGSDRKTSSSTPSPAWQNDVINLAGTKWTQTSTISQIKEFNFLPNGTINNDPGDTWRQNGNILIMEITNGYARYEGTITGDRIDYKAHNKVNLDWTGTLFRAQ